mmetsp:Transcript_18144/g.45509  ORF Transcript_18144/g.45509 Transcript_18144/m.45509 type:complete len:206 (-) Transcript_18144:760-1377(-)
MYLTNTFLRKVRFSAASLRLRAFCTSLNSYFRKSFSCLLSSRAASNAALTPAASPPSASFAGAALASSESMCCSTLPSLAATPRPALRAESAPSGGGPSMLGEEARADASCCCSHSICASHFSTRACAVTLSSSARNTRASASASAASSSSCALACCSDLLLTWSFSRRPTSSRIATASACAASRSRITALCVDSSCTSRRWSSA